MELFTLNKEELDYLNLINNSKNKHLTCQNTIFSTEIKPEYKIKKVEINNIPETSKDIFTPNDNFLNTIINKHTRKFHFHNPSDVIQSSMEFNNYLIHEMSKTDNKNILTDEQSGLCMDLIWENLKKLTQSADKYINDHHSLVKTNKYCEANTKLKSSNTPAKKDKNKFLNKKIKNSEIKESNISGLSIIVDKKILEEYQ
jgi:hypothetical protein